MIFKELSISRAFVCVLVPDFEEFFSICVKCVFFLAGGGGVQTFCDVSFFVFFGGGGGVGNYGKSSIHVYESNPCLP